MVCPMQIPSISRYGKNIYNLAFDILKGKIILHVSRNMFRWWTSFHDDSKILELSYCLRGYVVAYILVSCIQKTFGQTRGRIFSYESLEGIWRIAKNFLDIKIRQLQIVYRRSSMKQNDIYRLSHTKWSYKYHFVCDFRIFTVARDNFNVG